MSFIQQLKNLLQMRKRNLTKQGEGKMKKEEQKFKCYFCREIKPRSELEIVFNSKGFLSFACNQCLINHKGGWSYSD